MSQVTNIILTAGLSEEDAIGWINAKMNEPDTHSHGDGFTPLHKGNCPLAGNKTLEQTVCVGAFNYLSLDRFVGIVKQAPWYVPEDVRLFVCGQEDEVFYQVMPGALDTAL